MLSAMAMVAATGGSMSHFKGARHFAALFGLTAKGVFSGNARYLGRISKQGDGYLRMLLTHGARSILRAATVAQQAGRALDPLRCRTAAVQGRTNHNKAACALANKLARIYYATLRDAQPYAQHAPRFKHKIERTAFAIAA